MSSRSLIYTAFDRFPAPKGAATHIAAFVSALATDFDNVNLVTVAGPQSALSTSCAACERSPIPGVQHTELPAIGQTLIDRILSFRVQLRAWWGHRRPDVAHVRSIYEGYPIARQKDRWCEKFVFEVNGLPSIELKYHYPQAADDRELQQKLIAQEQCCLEAADLVFTVSDVNAAHLLQRGVSPERLVVIPNGVDLQLFKYQPPAAPMKPEMSLFYGGTLSSWQGVHLAVESLALYRREAPARLLIVGSGRPDQIETLNELAWKLNVGDYVQIMDGVSQQTLVQLQHDADAILVPLVPNDRNLVQGCSPLKLLEAMASGTPVIASDLPVVTSICRPDIDAILVKPGSAKAIKDALLRLRNEPDLPRQLSENARRRIEEQFTWEIAQEKLRQAYRSLL